VFVNRASVLNLGLDKNSKVWYNIARLEVDMTNLTLLDDLRRYLKVLEDRRTYDEEIAVTLHQPDVETFLARIDLLDNIIPEIRDIVKRYSDG